MEAGHKLAAWKPPLLEDAITLTQTDRQVGKPVVVASKDLRSLGKCSVIAPNGVRTAFFPQPSTPSPFMNWDEGRGFVERTTARSASALLTAWVWGGRVKLIDGDGP
jgi:hypothetical protein